MSAAATPLPAHLSHWPLMREPYRPVLQWSADRDLLFRSRCWEEATARVQYVLENQFGLAILTGPAGSGKSLLLEAAADQLLLQNIKPLRHRCQTGSAEHPWGVPADWETRQVLTPLSFATTQPLPQERYALLLDDFDRVSLPEAQLTTLVDHILQQRQLGCLVLVISQEHSLSLFESLSRYAPLMIPLKALSERESAEYLQTRFAQSGGQTELFEEPAAQLLHEQSAGIPRWLNRLAHECLLMGAFQGAPAISATIVEQTLQGMNRPITQQPLTRLGRAA